MRARRLQQHLYGLLTDPRCLKHFQDSSDLSARLLKKEFWGTSKFSVDSRINKYAYNYLHRIKGPIFSIFPNTCARIIKTRGGDVLYDLLVEFVQIFPSRQPTILSIAGDWPKFLKNHENFKKDKKLTELAKYEFSKNRRSNDFATLIKS